MFLFKEHIALKYEWIHCWQDAMIHSIHTENDTQNRKIIITYYFSIMTGLVAIMDS